MASPSANPLHPCAAAPVAPCAAAQSCARKAPTLPLHRPDLNEEEQLGASAGEGAVHVSLPVQLLRGLGGRGQGLLNLRALDLQGEAFIDSRIGIRGQDSTADDVRSEALPRARARGSDTEIR